MSCESSPSQQFLGDDNVLCPLFSDDGWAGMCTSFTFKKRTSYGSISPIGIYKIFNFNSFESFNV